MKVLGAGGGSVASDESAGHGPQQGGDRLIQHVDVTPTLLETVGVTLPDSLQGHSFWPLLCGEAYEPHDAIFIERNFHGQPVPGETGYRDMYDPVRSIRTPDYHCIRWFDPRAWHRPYLPWKTQALRDPDSALAVTRYGARGRPRNAEELYCVRHDPLERVDIGAQPEYRRIKADLAACLESWMQAIANFAL